MVPIESVAISGNHGLEVSRDGAVQLAPQAAKHLDAIRDGLWSCRTTDCCPSWAAASRTRESRSASISAGRRGPTTPGATWRRRSCPRWSGPACRPLRADGAGGATAGPARQGVGGASACAAGSGSRSCSTVGDDRSDVDAFREATMRIAVRSDEAPPELLELADAVVDGPAAVVEMLERLAGVCQPGLGLEELRAPASASVHDLGRRRPAATRVHDAEAHVVERLASGRRCRSPAAPPHRPPSERAGRGGRGGRAGPTPRAPCRSRPRLRSPGRCAAAAARGARSCGRWGGRGCRRAGSRWPRRCASSGRRRPAGGRRARWRPPRRARPAARPSSRACRPSGCPPRSRPAG